MSLLLTFYLSSRHCTDDNNAYAACSEYIFTIVPGLCSRVCNFTSLSVSPPHPCWYYLRLCSVFSEQRSQTILSTRLYQCDLCSVFFVPRGQGLDAWIDAHRLDADVI